MNILICKDIDEVNLRTDKIYAQWCADSGVKPSDDARIAIRQHFPPLVNSDTKAVAVPVPNIGLLSLDDAAKAIVVAKEDEVKWQPIMSAPATSG